MTRDELVERLQAQAKADDRVQAVFLSGSLGTGEADRFSDCDAVIAVDAARHADFVSGVRGWVAELFEPVIWRQLVPGVPLFHAVSPDWLRLDLTITTPDRLQGSQTTWKALYDPQGLHARLPSRIPERSPDVAKVLTIVEEFLRIAALLPLAVGREEYVVGASGVELLKGQLIALLIEAHAPAVPPGALHLSRILDAGEMAMLEAAPPSAATRQSVIESSLAYAAAFLPRAKALTARLGGAWPQALEEAARAHIARELGLELPC